MINSASWRVRTKNNAENFSQLPPEAVVNEINRRKQNNRIQTDREATDFINSVVCMTKCLPHSNEASKQARKDVFSMNINFGHPDIFLTVSPPDNNSLFITVYSGIEELPNNSSQITEEYLIETSTERSRIRFQYPGLSTLNFEVLLDIILKEVVGWKSKLPGFFGRPEAYFYAVEEQSRKTLHVHMLIWLDDTHVSLENYDLVSRKTQTRIKVKLYHL